MKVDYIYFGKEPALVISGDEFLKSLDTPEEVLLSIAINGFASGHRSDSHFNDDVIEVLKKYLSGNYSYLLTYQTRNFGMRGWCEVYVWDGRSTIPIVTSDDGYNFDLHQD